MTSRRLWSRLAIRATLVALGMLARLTVFAPDPVPVRTRSLAVQGIVSADLVDGAHIQEAVAILSTEDPG